MYKLYKERARILAQLLVGSSPEYMRTNADLIAGNSMYLRGMGIPHTNRHHMFLWSAFVPLGLVSATSDKFLFHFIEKAFETLPRCNRATEILDERFLHFTSSLTLSCWVYSQLQACDPKLKLKRLLDSFPATIRSYRWLNKACAIKAWLSTPGPFHFEDHSSQMYNLTEEKH